MKNSLYILISVPFFALFLLSPSARFATNDDWVVPDKYKKMENPYANVKDNEQIGRRAYSIHCKSCHGSKGMGDGSKAAQLDTRVPDLTLDAFKAESDGEMYYKTIFGKGDMPSFKEKITNEEDRWYLVNYLKAL